MTVTMKCGCRLTLERAASTAPVCEQHNERIVARVDGATPTFKGACSGPLVKT